jgi:hypothetical protein
VSGGGCSRAPRLRPSQPVWMPEHYTSSSDVLLGKRHSRSRADRCADAARASGTGAATQRPRCAIPRVPHTKDNLSTAGRTLFPSQPPGCLSTTTAPLTYGGSGTATAAQTDAPTTHGQAAQARRPSGSDTPHCACRALRIPRRRSFTASPPPCCAGFQNPPAWESR